MRTLSVWREGAHTPNFTFALADAPCGRAMEQTDLCAHTEQLAQLYPQQAPIAEAGFEAYVGQSLRDDKGEPIGVLNALWKHPIALTPELRALMSIFASRANAELLRLQRDREIQRLTETLEQRVRERTADLQKLNAELDSFAYSVSHDLKSPLRTIDGFTRLLDEQLGERLSSEERSMMQRVLAATHRMSGLIADLLALARVSQGALSPQRVDLSTMAHEILDQALEKQPERRVERCISPGLSAHCDERLARIALENLLNNALKYSRNQPLAVIEMGQTEALPGTPATLFVRDNGVGFDMAYADKLFKPFQRLHLPSEFEGTGIGLATVRRIIERHGGDISASAVPNQGASFTFSFQAAGATPAASSRLAYTQAVS
jgi:light-regulated signal transduction histidine kinase (bacteriophytochrome)